MSAPSRPLALVGQPAQTGPVEPLLDAAAVAAVLGVRPKRVYELGIPCVRISTRCLRWRRAAVETWLREREWRTL